MKAKRIVNRLKMAGNDSSALLLMDQELGQRQAAGEAPAAG
ncbi:hypothetical protein [Bacillus sp. AK031]